MAKHSHTYVQEKTPKCVHDWEYQFRCSDPTCGKLRDDLVYGVPPPEHVQNAQVREDALRASEQAIDLNEPADVRRLVEALFDANLDWTQTALDLFPTKRHKEAYLLAQEWQQDERVQKAVDAYVKSLATSEKQFALLMHKAQKLIDTGSGAVQATALNILKSARVTEKSQRDETSVIRVEGMDDIRAGVTGAVLEKATKSDEEEMVN